MKTKHFIVFVHGVNTRQREEDQSYARNLQKEITARLNQNIAVQFMPLYWGDVNKASEDILKQQLLATEIWPHLYLKNMRLNQIMQFVGDAVLYISRDIGSLVVATLADQAINGSTAYGFDGFTTADPNEANYIHLVTHSWGTVILFDILFASRWNDPTIRGYEEAQIIRNTIFGVGQQTENGLYLGSITTMGSPISLFSLMSAEVHHDGTPSSSHDITTDLCRMLRSLQQRLCGSRLRWSNHLHPGDLVAWPIENSLPFIVPGLADLAEMKDQLVTDAGPPKIFECVKAIALCNAGDAHHCYWNSSQLAESVVDKIMSVENRCIHTPNFCLLF